VAEKKEKEENTIYAHIQNFLCNFVVPCPRIISFVSRFIKIRLQRSNTLNER